MRFLSKLIPFVFIILLLLMPIFIRQKYFVDEAKGDADYILTTGETCGIYNPLGKAMATVMNRELERHHIQAIDSKGSIVNIKRLNNDAHFAILQGDIVKIATRDSVGLPDATNVRGILVLYKEFLQIYVRKDSEVKEIADLKGKIVSVGLRGSAICHNARSVFETLGIDYDTEIYKRFYTLGQSLDELEHGSIDAAFFFGGRGIYEVEKVNKRCKLRMLSVPKPAINQIIDSGFPVIKFQITNDDYSFIDTPVSSLGQVAILACRKDMPDWIVRRFRQTVLSNTDVLMFAHHIAGEIKTIDQELMPIELHESLKEISDERLEFFSLAIILAAAVLLMAFSITLNVVFPHSFQRFRQSVLNFNKSYVTVIIIMLLFLALTVFIGAFIVYQSESHVPGTLYADYSSSLKNMLYSVILGFDNKHMPVSMYGGIIVNVLFLTYLMNIVMLTTSIMAILLKPCGKLKPMKFYIERDLKKARKEHTKSEVLTVGDETSKDAT